ncbi:MAG: glycosyltransferase [Cyclobacteriaceae bacterium]
MLEENKIINGLWIGNSLSCMELLTMASFINHGHQFHLWVYDKILTELPSGVLIKNANDIIHESEIFEYENLCKNNLGKGSVAGFSDLFRYKLLHDVGGWWVDMDITCLRPFDFTEPYVFPDHDLMPLTGRIMKTPIKCPAMRRAYQETKNLVDKTNKDWMRPIKILVNQIEVWGLSKYIKRGMTNIDSYIVIQALRHQKINIPKEWYAVHWCNEVWRTYGLKKDEVIVESFYGQLMADNEIYFEAKNPTVSIGKMTVYKIFKFVTERSKLLTQIKAVNQILNFRIGNWVS